MFNGCKYTGTKIMYFIKSDFNYNTDQKHVASYIAN